MTQNWNLPTDTNVGLSAAVVTRIPDAVRSVATMFAGATEPPTTFAYQLWLDTGDNVIKQRNASDTDWVVVMPFGVALAEQTIHTPLGALTDTTTKFVAVAQKAGNVKKLCFVGDMTTTGSVASTTEWTVMLTNKTAANDLFSADPGTATLVAGVGGGSEWDADAAETFVPDQNALVAAGDVLEVTITKTGSPTTFGEASLFLEIDAIPV